MNSAFYSGVSGVKSSQYGMDVLSNNIANVNTVGYKQNQTEFSALFSDYLQAGSIGSVTSDLGLGSRTVATPIDMSNGSYQNSDNIFDLAIGGNGWFGVSGVEGEIFYTRAGTFGTDAAGTLVNNGGYKVLGTMAGNISDAGTVTLIDGVTLTAVGNQTSLILPESLNVPANPTRNLSYTANLDPDIYTDLVDVNLDDADYTLSIDTVTSSASLQGGVANTTEALDPQPEDRILVTLTDVNGNTVTTYTQLDENLTWQIDSLGVDSLDLTEPLQTDIQLRTYQEVATTESFTTSIVAPDGEENLLRMTFVKQVPQGDVGTRWSGEFQILRFPETYDPQTQYDPATTYVDEESGNVYSIVDAQNGEIAFNENGALTANTMPSLNNGGATLNVDLGTLYDSQTANSGFDGLMALGGVDMDPSVTQDGFSAGELKSYSVNTNGEIIAYFDNGRGTPIAQITLFHFQNEQGLEKTDGTLFSASTNSGDAFFYSDAQGDQIQGANIYTSMLENSNVSLATALTELIVMQKSFDANAKSITTGDQLIQKAINMKR